MILALVIAGGYVAEPALSAVGDSTDASPAREDDVIRPAPPATSGVAASEDAAAGAEAKALPDDPRTPGLVERVKARWDAKMKRDFNALYMYETPEYRKQFTAEAFGNRHGAFVTWHGIEVATIRFGDNDEAVVDLVIDHTYIHPFDSNPVRAKTLLRERWAKVSGEWFHDTPLIKTEQVSEEGASDESVNEQGPHEGAEAPTPAETQDGTP